MKILIIKTFPQEINISKITYNHQELGLAAALRAKGHVCDVMCVASNNVPATREVTFGGERITVYCMKAVKLLKNAWFKHVEPILNQYDILQAGEYNQLYTWHLAKKHAGNMVCYHGPYYSPFNRRYNMMARVFDALLVNRYRRLGTTFITKSRLAEQYLKSKGIGDVTAVGVGLGVTIMSSEEHATIPLVQKIGKLQGAKLLYIGVLEDRRNSMFLLDVAQALRAMGFKFTLVLVGRFANASYEADFWQKVKSTGLESSIVHEQVVEQKVIRQVYAACDVFLLPTRYDIYGMVLLEAMYLGMPTITTMCGGAEMMIESGKNGIIINDFNAKEWADNIVRLCSQSQLMQQLGAEAHATVAQHFTWEALADEFVKIYRKKLGQGK